jgi:hypothetical protein
MRSILWKELRENARWAAILFAGVAVSLTLWAAVELPWGRIDQSIASDEVLAVLLLAAPLGALGLGFLQILPEIQRDAWAFLVHRPVAPTGIFLAKIIVGTGLYFTAILVPFLAVALWTAAGAPEHRVFHPLMLWPGMLIVLASAGLHPAAMLVVLRPARWFGTRLLPLALPSGALLLAVSWVFDVSEIPSPAMLISILAAHAVVATAAWGSFVRGGEATGQPLSARLALGLGLAFGTLGILAGLAGLGIGVTCEIMPRETFERRNGAGRRAGSAEDWNAITFHRIHTGHWPARERVAQSLRWSSGAAGEWILSADGLIHGYREEASRLARHLRPWRFRIVRIVAPDGFREPSPAPPEGFGPVVPARWPSADSIGPADHGRRSRRQLHREVLACREGIYEIDLAREEVRLLLPAPGGEPIRGASVEQSFEGAAEIAIASDRTVRFYSAREEVVGTATDEATGETADIRGFFPDRETFAAAIPAAIPRGLEESFAVGRVPGRDILVFTTGRETRTFQPERIFEADASGRILRRSDGLDSGTESELARAGFLAAAAFAPLALAGAAAFADEVLMAGEGPGYLRLSAVERPGWTVAFAAILTLQALACAGLAWAAARRHGFSRGKRRLLTALGALLGPAGLVALAGARDWSPTPACAACGRRRGVSVRECPYCGRALEPPARDGTEVIERTPSAEPTGIHSRSLP